MSGLTLDLDAVFAGVAACRAVGVAVSGGPDSLALMLLAQRWAGGRTTPRLIVYSVDHGLRPEAADEVAMVMAAAARLGLSARALRWQGAKPATGIQAAARGARYRLLAEAMAADGAEVLLTAHHLADQAETVLMRLAHGSGIEGLRGMDAFATVEGCNIHRPLLALEPERLHAMVAEAGLLAAHDPGNLDRHYERVRWRQMLAELTELGLDPKRLGTFARRMADADAVIAAAADTALAAIADLAPDGSAALRHDDFSLLPRAVRTRVLAEVLRRVGGDRRPHGLSAVEALGDRLARPGTARAATLHGCTIAADAGAIAVRREGPRKAAFKTQAGVTAD